MIRAVNDKILQAVGKPLHGADNWRLWATGPSGRELETYLVHRGAAGEDAHKGAKAIVADRKLHMALQAWGELSRALVAPTQAFKVQAAVTLTYGGIRYGWDSSKNAWYEVSNEEESSVCRRL